MNNKKYFKEYYLKNKNKIDKQTKEYEKKYPWKKIFRCIKNRCNNPKNASYKHYGLKGIQCNITEEELKFLWFRDKAYLMKKASIDRKNSKKNYTLDNCQFIELVVNASKATKKAILQYSKSGTLIQKFFSITEASIKLNCHISTISLVLRGKNKTAKGFKWRYKYE